MKYQNVFYIFLVSMAVISGCKNKTNSPVDKEVLEVEVFETSAGGNKLKKITVFDNAGTNPVTLKLVPDTTYQTITGFGGAFTEASAYLLNQLSAKNRDSILRAYFGKNGANYSLCRTHMNSCDFSLSNYTYAPIEGDMKLEYFSIEEDEKDLLPMIKDAMATSEDGFKLFASPWTAPPWMKDNKKYVGGKLLPEYYDVWALFYSKYLEAYKAEGIDIWGFTVVNEPHGNGNNWESMLFSPEEMTDFVKNYMGPSLEAHGHGDVVILGYDQNRNDLKHWVDTMYKDVTSENYFDGTAIHWYDSTYLIFEDELNYAHEKAPDKYLIQTEACVDAEIPHWKDDAWYWSKEATDWGWDWASEDQKPWHPKYVPVYRYARDIIGCLNNWVDGWVDWNMVLNRQGGPNWFKNWCVAPVIVDEKTDEIYFTPIYHVMVHFSKFIRPGAKRIGIEISDKELHVTAAINPDGTIVVVLLNTTKKQKNISLLQGDATKEISINPSAIQTILIAHKTL